MGAETHRMAGDDMTTHIPDNATSDQITRAYHEALDIGEVDYSLNRYWGWDHDKAVSHAIQAMDRAFRVVLSNATALYSALIK